MNLQYKIDEFAIILIGALIFFIGLTAVNYYIKQPVTNITNISNLTLISKMFILDGLEKKVSLIEIEDKIYRSFFEEKKLPIKLEISRDEIKEISKIIINFESKKNLSKLYLIENKLEIPAKSEYSKNEIKERMYFVTKIEEYDTSLQQLILYLIIASGVIIFLTYREYPKLRDKIKIFGIGIIISLLILFFSLSTTRINDEVKVSIYAFRDFAEKTFYFQAFPKNYNIKIFFDIGNSLKTNKLKIYLNDELIYENIPFQHSIRIVLNNVNLNRINKLKFETFNAFYEIKNLYILLS